LRYNHVSVL